MKFMLYVSPLSHNPARDKKPDPLTNHDSFTNLVFSDINIRVM